MAMDILQARARNGLVSSNNIDNYDWSCTYNLKFRINYCTWNTFYTQIINADGIMQNNINSVDMNTESQR